MISIASLLVRKSLGLLKGSAKEYTPGVLAAFDGAEFVTTYPDGTNLDVALASAEYENTRSSQALRSLMELEARDGNTDAAAWLARYPA